MGFNAPREARLSSIGGGEPHEHLVRRGGCGDARGEEENEKLSHAGSLPQAGKMTNAQEPTPKLKWAGDEEGVLFEEAEGAVPGNVLREKQDDHVAENERQGQGQGR